jgi:hypothetical protein
MLAGKLCFWRKVFSPLARQVIRQTNATVSASPPFLRVIALFVGGFVGMGRRLLLGLEIREGEPQLRWIDLVRLPAEELTSENVESELEAFDFTLSRLQISRERLDLAALVFREATEVGVLALETGVLALEIFDQAKEVKCATAAGEVFAHARLHRIRNANANAVGQPQREDNDIQGLEALERLASEEIGCLGELQSGCTRRSF